MTFALWSSYEFGDQTTHFFRPTSAGSINPLFGFGIVPTSGYSASGDNNLYLSLTGQDYFGNLDETPAIIGPFLANPSKVGGTAAGVMVFGNGSASTPTVAGGAFWLTETASGSNTYNVNYETFNYSVSGIPASGSSVTLSGSYAPIETNVANITSFNWDWTGSTFVFGYETTASGAPTKSIFLQSFTSGGSARGPLTEVATLATGAIWDVREFSTTTDGFLFEDNSSANAGLAVESFTPGSGALTSLGKISTSLTDLTAFNFAGSVYAFAGKDSAGNAKIEFDLVDNSFNVTASHSLTLSGATAATRIIATALPNGAGEVFAYADPNNNNLHLVQVDAAANIVQDLIVGQSTAADRLRSFGDGRVEIEWRTTVSGAQNEVHFAVYDTRTAGISSTGGNSNDWLAGTPFNDTIAGGAGNDRIGASAGSNTLDGGTGDDTALLGFKLTDASLSFDSAGHVVLDGPGTHDVLSNFEHFQFNDGTVTRFTGSPLVDNLYYDVAYKDVFAAHVDPAAHYFGSGWTEGRNPNAYFSTVGYLAANPDVKAAGYNPLTHFDSAGWKEGRDPSASFDVGLYLQHNPDVAAAGIDPLFHYLSSGQAEGRQAYAAIGSAAQIAANGFDREYYLLANPDVAAAGIDPYTHFETTGWKEGRNPNALFDTKAYLAANPDVAAAGINPLDHYASSGWKEGRNPSTSFDTDLYLKQNPDVAAANIDPLTHYLLGGHDEGRQPPASGQMVSTDVKIFNFAFATAAVSFDYAGHVTIDGADGSHTTLNLSDVGHYRFTDGVINESHTGTRLLVDDLFYYAQNKDVWNAHLDAADHFYASGWTEGRNPDLYFDTKGYLSAYPDVAAAGLNPLAHYDQSGWKEGRDPSTHFDTQQYESHYPDVAAAGVDPLLNFLSSGQAAGRHAFDDGSFHQL